MKINLNPIRLLFAAVAAAALFCQSAGASIVLQDEFQYDASGRLGDPSTGGSYVPAWTSAQNTSYITNGSGSLVGTNLGLVASFGDKVNLLGLTNGAAGGVVTNTGDGASVGIQNGCYNKFATVNKTFDPNNAPTNVYTSFLYQFKNGYDLTNGNVLVQMNDVSGGISSSSGARAYWQLIGRWTGSAVQLGIAKNPYSASNVYPGANQGVTNWDATLLSPGQTYFVVVRLQLNATNASTIGGDYHTNVIDDLWINPAPASFSVAEGSVPAPDVSSPVGDGTVSSSSSGPGRFFIADTYAVGWLDELRIGTTWADVTPYFGQCIPVSILNSPTNITQSAEIPAILNCNFTGTGATNQWQISKNSGATWSDIPGAIGSVYITPNLQLPGDNLNEYRCVIGNSCGSGSSVTSAVATVTLNATTPTSPGVIMNDPFTGQIFNYPVTSANSVWFSLLDSSQNPYFSDYPGPGATALTITNSSTLYVGYFVNSNAAPVDLAIGSSIRVTFPFTPNDFSLFTGNGPLRFGLYDYRDLGVPITTSSTSLTGSAGQAYGVMGYMLSLDFGPSFSDTTPLNLYARNNLFSPGLASSTGDYASMSAGPGNGGVNTNLTVFQSGVSNTLIFTVTRTATNTCVVTTTITNAIGLNISFSSGDTNNYGWHRFDSFALRPNSGVSSCANFFIPSFKVEVIGGVTVVPTSISITNISRPGGTNSIYLGWQALPSGGTYSYSVLSATNLSGPWKVNTGGLTANNYTDNNTITNNTRVFYRITSP
jgi:hypothetical protein